MPNGYYKHVAYTRRDSRTGKLIRVQGGRTPDTDISISSSYNSTDEHLHGLHKHIQKQKPKTEHELQRHVHDFVSKRYVGDAAKLLKLKNLLLRAVFDEGMVQTQTQTQTTQTTQTTQPTNRLQNSRAAKDREIAENLTSLGLTRDELLAGMVPSGFSCESVELWPEHNGVFLRADIYDKKGGKQGTFSRRFIYDTNKRSLVVTNVDFKLLKSTQHKGLGSLIIATQLDTIEKLAKRFKGGVTVKLMAITDRDGKVGAYVWPRLGFTVDAKSFKSLVQYAKETGYKDLARSKNMSDFLKHSEARKILTTESLGLDCYTILGSSAYRQLRSNLATIISKHKQGILQKALNAGYMKHKGYIRVVNGKAQYIKGGKPEEVNVTSKLHKDPILRAVHKHIIKQKHDEQSLHHAIRDHVEANYTGIDSKKEVLVKQLLEALHKEGVISLKTAHTVKPVKPVKDVKDVSLLGVEAPTAEDRVMVREWVIASNKSRAAIAFRLAANAILGRHANPRDALSRVISNVEKNANFTLHTAESEPDIVEGSTHDLYLKRIREKITKFKTRFSELIDEELQRIPERVESLKRIAKESQSAYKGQKTITLYRGIKHEQAIQYHGKRNIDLACDSVASFTDNLDVAYSFSRSDKANGKDGIIVAVEVPVSSVLVSYKAFKHEAAMVAQRYDHLESEHEVCIFVNGTLKGKPVGRISKATLDSESAKNREWSHEITRSSREEYTYTNIYEGDKPGHTHKKEGYTLPINLSHIYGKDYHNEGD